MPVLVAKRVSGNLGPTAGLGQDPEGERRRYLRRDDEGDDRQRREPIGVVLPRKRSGERRGNAAVPGGAGVDRHRVLRQRHQPGPREDVQHRVRAGDHAQVDLASQAHIGAEYLRQNPWLMAEPELHPTAIS